MAFTQVDVVVVTLDTGDARDRIGTLQCGLQILGQAIQLGADLFAVGRVPKGLAGNINLLLLIKRPGCFALVGALVNQLATETIEEVDLECELANRIIELLL